MTSAVLLIDPKFAHNVGGALRACAAWGIPKLRWTGDRIDVEEIKRTGRLPREERMKAYKDEVDWRNFGDTRPLQNIDLIGMTPICVEVGPGHETLSLFEHPEKAVYVFGPEDGGVPKGIKHACHHFVSIPTHVCLNLAAAINVVLYDRRCKLDPDLRIEESLRTWQQDQ